MPTTSSPVETSRSGIEYDTTLKYTYVVSTYVYHVLDTKYCTDLLRKPVVIPSLLVNTQRRPEAIEEEVSSGTVSRLWASAPTAGPGKRYLYIHALLLSLFRRKRIDRYFIPQVFTGQIWATPGKWARRSMVQASSRRRRQSSLQSRSTGGEGRKAP